MKIYKHREAIAIAENLNETRYVRNTDGAKCDYGAGMITPFQIYDEGSENSEVGECVYFVSSNFRKMFNIETGGRADDLHDELDFPDETAIDDVYFDCAKRETEEEFYLNMNEGLQNFKKTLEEDGCWSILGEAIQNEINNLINYLQSDECLLLPLEGEEGSPLLEKDQYSSYTHSAVWYPSQNPHYFKHRYYYSPPISISRENFDKILASMNKIAKSITSLSDFFRPHTDEKIKSYWIKLSEWTEAIAWNVIREDDLQELIKNWIGESCVEGNSIEAFEVSQIDPLIKLGPEEENVDALPFHKFPLMIVAQKYGLCDKTYFEFDKRGMPLNGRANHSVQKSIEMQAEYDQEKVPVPVFLSTDAGRDVDDIKALVSLVKAISASEGKFELSGVLSGGEEVPDEKACIVKSVLAELNMGHTPVYYGEKLLLSNLPIEGVPADERNYEHALSIPEETQKNLLVKSYHTYPANKFGGFYPFHGRAYQKFREKHNVAADANMLDAIQHVRSCIDNSPIKSEVPKVLVISIGGMTEVASLFEEEGFAENIMLHHMGGWYGPDKNSDPIFPRGRMGHNTVCDIDASEKVFNHPDANIVVFNSHLKELYDLTLADDVNGLLTLADEQFPAKELPLERKHNLLKSLVQRNQKREAKQAPDLSEEAIEQLNDDSALNLINQYKSKIFVSSMPYASPLGLAIAKDCACWIAYTSFVNTILLDPSTVMTALELDFITGVGASVLDVTIKINSALAKENQDKYMESDFHPSIITHPGGNTSIITGLHSPEMIVKKIAVPLIQLMYPGVSYDEFMEVAKAEGMTITAKQEQLHELINSNENSTDVNIVPEIEPAVTTTVSAAL